MSVTSALVLFAVLWFLILLMLLPIGVQSQQEAGRVEPGTPPGAPAGAFLARKLRWTTILTTIAFAVIYAVIVGGVITHDDIRHFAPFATR
jgi:predicted secreted protein